MDLSDSNISYIDSDIDWLAGDTTIIIFVNQKEFELSVNEYTHARWLDIDGREEPIPPGDLHILEKYNIIQDNIKVFPVEELGIFFNDYIIKILITKFCIGGNIYIQVLVISHL